MNQHEAELKSMARTMSFTAMMAQVLAFSIMTGGVSAGASGGRLEKVLAFLEKNLKSN